jgi:hypothetical protein
LLYWYIRRQRPKKITAGGSGPPMRLGKCPTSTFIVTRDYLPRKPRRILRGV